MQDPGKMFPPGKAQPDGSMETANYIGNLLKNIDASTPMVKSRSASDANSNAGAATDADQASP